MRTEESGIGSFEEEREIEEMGSLRRGVRWKEEERGRRRRATAMRRDVMGDRMLVERLLCVKLLLKIGRAHV